MTMCMDGVCFFPLVPFAGQTWAAGAQREQPLLPTSPRLAPLSTPRPVSSVFPSLGLPFMPWRALRLF